MAGQLKNIKIIITRVTNYIVKLDENYIRSVSKTNGLQNNNIVHLELNVKFIKLLIQFSDGSNLRSK